jgi:exonuclease III
LVGVLELGLQPECDPTLFLDRLKSFVLTGRYIPAGQAVQMFQTAKQQVLDEIRNQLADNDAMMVMADINSLPARIEQFSIVK